MAPPEQSWRTLQRRYYEANLEDYERERALRGRAYRRKAAILRAALDPADRTVLEVGAGSGLVTALLAPQVPGARYVALDLAHAMLTAARRRTSAPVHYLVADVTATGLADASVDSVVGVDILHHLSDPTAALREWARVTRPGGRLAVLETNPYNPVNLAFIGVEHELRLFMNSPDNLRTWATAGGWSDVDLRTTPTFTPSGRPGLAAILDRLDRLAMHVPGARWLTALWLLVGRKPATSAARSDRP